MKLFKLDHVSLPCAVFSVPLSLASWYTWKIDRMGEALLHPEYPLLYNFLFSPKRHNLY